MGGCTVPKEPRLNAGLQGAGVLPIAGSTHSSWLPMPILKLRAQFSPKVSGHVRGFLNLPVGDETVDLKEADV